ncbi:transmembrane protein 177 [Python bivittatus]|uniref:Transmembrane protein 177 n=1 Tax=Python bivittatus TaxID=176946 RepID=A0A9F2WGE3_PYTBI|nr:transmembrane protein 177 [Python bivittatus]XP_025025535.1 transmembrane protein 177 [Python bivittatus]XP_025025536.1 transmembrane protein 177 [Python bivittatus]
MAFHSLWKAVSIMEQHRTAFLSISCAGLFGANLTLHIFSKELFKTIYQAWDHGKPLELSEDLQSLFYDILRDVKVKSADCYDAIKTCTLHPVSAGLPWRHKGCVVGIPYHFSDTSSGEQQIAKIGVLLKGRKVDWTSTEGLTLKDALTLSPEAQKFAIAREIINLQQNRPLACAAVGPICLAGSCISGVAVKQVLGLYYAPVLFRGIYNMAVVALGFVGYCLLYDTISQAFDYRTDRNTASISPSFARGGVEFYSKVLSQNKAFRTIMGKEGEQIYASNGNILPKFRLKHPSYTSRRNLIINMLNPPQA